MLKNLLTLYFYVLKSILISSDTLEFCLFAYKKPNGPDSEKKPKSNFNLSNDS